MMMPEDTEVVPTGEMVGAAPDETMIAPPDDIIVVPDWLEVSTNIYVLLHMAAVLLVLIVIGITARIILSRLTKKGRPGILRDSILFAIPGPFRLALWGIGLWYIMDLAIMAWKPEEYFSGYGKKIPDLVLIAALAWFMFRWRKIWENLWIERKGTRQVLPGLQIGLLRRIIMVIFILIIGMMTLQAFGLPLTTILAFGGLGGAAAAFASKDVLANFFSGFMLQVTHPFSIGEWINSPDKDIEGYVEEMGWYYTMVRRFDKRPIYIPNSIFSSVVVRNPSRMSNRQIRDHIGIRYCDLHVIENIVEDITVYLNEHDDIDHTKTTMVSFDKFNSHSLDIFIYTFTKTTAWSEFLKIKQEVYVKIGKIVHGYGADFAFPTTTLDFPEGMDKPVPPEPTPPL